MEVTGQTQCWDESGVIIDCADTGQDGELQAGVPSPEPRFTDNGNGRVRDNLTGLIWLKNANCFGEQSSANARQAAQQLASPQCDLTDGSVADDWRLPNVRNCKAWRFDRHLPALPTGDPFVGVFATRYWSSTTAAAGIRRRPSIWAQAAPSRSINRLTPFWDCTYGRSWGRRATLRHWRYGRQLPVRSA